MLALLLAAGAALAPAHGRAPANRSVEQRVALLEARQMLESQALWSLQAAFPTESARVLADVDLHLLRDQDQEERVRLLTAQVRLLEQRLASLELLAQGRAGVEGGPTPVLPAAAPPSGMVPLIGQPVVHARARPAAKPKPAKPAHPPSGERLAGR